MTRCAYCPRLIAPGTEAGRDGYNHPVCVDCAAGDDAPGPETEACAFCGRGRDEAAVLDVGPGVAICDECVRLCGEIVAEQRPAPSGPDGRAR